MQFDALYGLSAVRGIAQWVLTSNRLKMSVENRILVMTCLKKGVSVSDVLVIVATIENWEQYKPQLQSADHFTEILVAIKQNPFKQ